MMDKNISNKMNQIELTLGEKDAISKLKFIITEGSPGIYSLLGERGTGKTSLKDVARLKDNESAFIEIPYFINDENMYFNLVDGLYAHISDLYNKDQEKFSDLKKRIDFLIAIYSGEVSSTSMINSTNKNEREKKKNKKIFGKSEIKHESEVNTPKIIPVSISANLSSSVGVSGDYAITNTDTSYFERMKEVQVKKFITEQWKQDELIKILNLLSKEKRVVLIIDELDKLTFGDIKQLLFNNKSLFLDSGMITLLISDLHTGIELQENIKEYISSFIILNKMTFREYYIKRSNMSDLRSFRKDFLSIQNEFYLTEGVNRKLFDLLYGLEEVRDEELALLYNVFCMSKLCESTDKIYLNTLKKYTKELLFFIKTVKLVSNDQLSRFTNKFIENNNLSNTNLNYLLENYFKLNPFVIDDNYFHQEYVEKLFKRDEYISFSDSILYDDLKCAYDDFKTGYIDYLIKKTMDEEGFLNKYLPLEADISIIYGLLNNSKVKFTKIEEDRSSPYNSVDLAKTLIKNKKNKIIGMSIFYTNGDEYVNPFINGYIYERIDEDNVKVHSFIGYPGLTSHKPRYLEQLINFLEVEKVKHKIYKDVYDSEEEASRDIKKFIEDISKMY